MARLLLDFDGVNLDGPEPIPEGIYTARIDTSETEVKQGQKAAYITLKYVVEGHPEYAGRTIYDNLPVTGKGLFRLGRLLRALGLPVDQKYALNTDDLHNRLVRIVVKNEEYEGRIRNRVNEVLPAEGEAKAAEVRRKKIAF